MTLEEIKELYNSPLYAFIRTNPHLGENNILIGLGGSYAYGTNIDTSDLDIRGVAMNSKKEILLGKDFEQVDDKSTDTVIYSFNKMIRLLCSCNPNTIEILGLKPEHYLYMSPLGQELIDNKEMFLSKAVINSFGGYANQQLRRLDNKNARNNGSKQQMENVIKSIEHAEVDYKRKYCHYDADNIKLHVDKKEQSDDENNYTVFTDISLKNYPLEDFTALMNDMNNILRMYKKTSGRANNATVHNKLAKHMMHLVRLYHMCFDILEKHEINTYRENDHDELMGIRNGKYLNENGVIPEFYEIADELEKRLEYDKNNTDLPEQVNKTQVENFVYDMNATLFN